MTESDSGLTLRAQRSNYAEVDIDPDQADSTAENSGRRRGSARQTLLSDKRPSVHPNKKSTMNIRTALLYKKNLATLIEESVSTAGGSSWEVLISCLKGVGSLPPSVPGYHSAAVPPPKEPPRLFCTVCGYWGKYRCMKCALPFCSRDCEENHQETQCERRIVC